MEARLRETEAQLEAAGVDAQRVEAERATDVATIQRLQALVEAMQETGESQSGQLEAELLARSSECAALRRDCAEQRRRVEELMRWQQDMRTAEQDGRSLRDEVAKLTDSLQAAEQEKASLSSVVERCVEKLEKESRERPHLVDKRMVTQMLASYLEQNDNPDTQWEIMAKMADLLGFTTQEREQVGLTKARRSLLERQEEPANLSELGDRFVDFLFEESEG
jgi:hypothetical protein